MTRPCFQSVTNFEDAIKNCMLLPLVDAYNGFVYVCSEDYRVEYMSERLVERTGRDAAGEACYKVLHGIDAKCPWCANPKVFNGETVGYEVKSPKDNRWFDIANLPLKKTDGSMAKLAIFFDITERKEMYDRVKRSEARCRAILENSVDAIFLADPETGMIKDVNKMAEELTGISRKKLLGMHQSELHPKKHENFYKKIFSNHIKQGKVADHKEYLVQRADGTTVPVEINANVIDIDGEKIIQGIFRDISERKKMWEERMIMDRRLLRAQKFETLATLSGGIAHDFNNILVSIIGNADLARIKLSGDSPVIKNLENITKAAKRATDLTGQMLAFSGQGSYELETINLSEFIENFSLLLNTLVKKGTMIRYDLTRDIPLIKGDPAQIKRALINVVLNASESMDEMDRTINIGTGTMDADKKYLSETYPNDDLQEGKYVFIKISDTGCGMDRETTSKIFDPFFSTKFIGRGLGLSAVIGIMKGHNGAVKVYSKPGHGSSFTLLFPCLEESYIFEEKTPIEKPAKTFEDGITVLIIDDDKSVRNIFKMILETAGIKAIIASSGIKGLNIFKSKKDEIDLVILDLTMPHMGGEETYRKLRRISPDVKVLLTSGYSETEAAQKFPEKGLCGFIQKPSDLKKLVSKVKSTLNIAP